MYYGIFSKPEVTILKEGSDTKVYLEKLENLLTMAEGEIKTKIQKEIAIVKAGITGEENILFELKNSDMDLVVLQDIYIETQDGRGAQIDFIVISSKLIFLIECKNLFGNIEINSRGDFIHTIQYGNRWFKEGIYSPITQNERHLSVLKECSTENKNGLWKFFIRKNFDDFYKSLIVLANPKTVVNYRYAKKEIKNREERKDYFAKYENLMNEIKELEKSSDDNKIENTADQSPDQSANEEIDKKKWDMSGTALVCPRCGSELVVRTAKKGKNVGNMFYGCSNFPKCRFVRNIGQPEKED